VLQLDSLIILLRALFFGSKLKKIIIVFRIKRGHSQTELIVFFEVELEVKTKLKHRLNEQFMNSISKRRASFQTHDHVLCCFSYS